MKKFLSIILAAILLFSVMAPITVFAENGPKPFDPSSETIDLTELSTITFMNMIVGDEEDIISIESTILYPQDNSYMPPYPFKGASYELETNTLTLNNVIAKYGSLVISEMGDDFKIKLIGYNELGSITSYAGTRGGSVTITGNGELVINRTKEFDGIIIDANETYSTLTVEDSVKLKAYAVPEYEMPAIEVYCSLCTNTDDIIKLGGTIKGKKLEVDKYTINYYEQAEAYDLFWDSYDWYDFGLEKDGTYYIADEYLASSIFSSNKYEIYALSYDELLDCYTITPYNNGNLSSIKDFTVLTENAPIYDKVNGYYIGFTDEAEENDKSYKRIFEPEEKTPFDLCVDKNGTKYGFWQENYEGDYYDED